MKSKKRRAGKVVSKDIKNELSGVFDKGLRKQYVRKFWITLAVLLLIFILLFLIGYFTNPSLTGNVIDPGNTEDPLGIGINPDNVPETPEELANVSREYLIREWKKVATNNTFFGPVLLVVNPILRVFCGYEFSPFLEFFVAFILALILLTFFTNGLNVAFRNFLLSLAVGFLITVIAVAGGVMKLVVPKIVFLLNNKWIIIGFFVACAVIIGLFDYLGRYINKKREENALNQIVKGKGKGPNVPNLDDVKETIEEAKAVKAGYDESETADTSTWD